MENIKNIKNQQVLFYCPDKLQIFDENLLSAKGLKTQTLTKGFVLDTYIVNKEEIYTIFSVNTFANIIYLDDKENYKIISIPTNFIQGIYKN